MKIAIDATNIGGGGGTTHLIEILNNFDYNLFCDDEIFVYSSEKILNELPVSVNIHKKTYKLLNKGLFGRLYFQLFKFDKEIRKDCDILFSITGDYLGNFKPLVGMSRNMLLYERSIWREIKQPKEILRFYLNYLKQKYCFGNADGIIFISKYAKKVVCEKFDLAQKEVRIIHHGVSNNFKFPTKPNSNITECSFVNPFRFIYVSTIHVYKHQWNVITAISELRNQGFPVEIHFIGEVIFEPAGKLFYRTVNKLDPKREFVHIHGKIPYDKVCEHYKKANGIIFASTCENMPNILIESMASGLPIVSSNKQPMPEFLEDGGIYFNPKNICSLVNALKKLLIDEKLINKYTNANVDRINNYSWKKTSINTFSFLHEIYAKNI
jgi:glycosyltransferase involved in cell wall biosynthesis